MTGVVLALVALASALLLWPRSSRRRLVAAGLESRAARRRARTPTPYAAAVAMVAAVAVPISVAFAGAVVAGTIVLRRRRRNARRRIDEDSSALESALDVFVGELRTGAHPVVALRVAAAEAHGSVGTSFRAVSARAVLGADVSAGLRSAATSSTRPAYWERLAVCWELAHMHGLPMAALMRTAQRDIVERARFDAQVTAGMAGARATAAVLAALPFAGVALGEMIGAQPLRFLISGGAGGWLLMIGVTLTCCGLLWSDRITAQVMS